MRRLTFALASLLSLPALAATAPTAEQLRHAHAILKAAPLVDGHNDLPYEIRESKTAPRDVDAYDLNATTAQETDIARLKRGHVGAQFWAVYVPGELKAGWARYGLEQTDITRRMIARYPAALMPAYTSTDIRAAFKAGKVASLLGLEGGHMIENSLGALRAFHALGARYMTLTHNVTLDWADAAMDAPRHHGLTPFGKEVVREMNRLGMLVDLSHTSADVMRDAIDTSVAPVLFSHSSARALVDHPRNVPDAILAKVAANGGVVMVTFVPSFVSQASATYGKGLQPLLKAAGADDAAHERIRLAYAKEHGEAPLATLAQVADHIDHVAKVAGRDHVGIAADFGGAKSPVGLEDVSTYPALFAELIRRGWSDQDLMKLASGNVLRAMAQAEAVAARLQRERKASTATIEQLDGAKP